MPYDQITNSILEKYWVTNPDGSLRTAPLRPSDPDRTRHPYINPDVLDRLVKADPTPDKRWLEWIMFNAGGGKQAHAKSVSDAAGAKSKFINTRVAGYTLNGVTYAPMLREKAEELWKKNEATIINLIMHGDQPLIDRCHTFGYYRTWPGKDNRYAHVVDAMQQFMAVYPQLKKLNAELKAQGKTTLADSPRRIENPTEMLNVVDEVKRHIAAKKARTDVREETVYDDDNLSVIVPLTYAAALKYGYSGWNVANPETFERVLTVKGAAGNWQDPWNTITSSQQVPFFIHFKAPVPGWTSSKRGEYKQYDFTDLVLPLSVNDAEKVEPKSWSVIDQENRVDTTLWDVTSAITSAGAKAQPEDASPLDISMNAWGQTNQSPEEAQSVVDSLNKAVKEIQRWIKEFDHQKIVTPAV
jgi:hypothetical protein